MANYILHSDPNREISFEGSRTAFGKYGSYDATLIFNHVKDSFRSKGVKKVILNGIVDNIPYEDLTVAINPRPVNPAAQTTYNNTDFQEDGMHVLCNSTPHWLDEDRQEIKFKDHIIGLFYPTRRLYMCFINMMKPEVRRKHFDVCFGLFFKETATFKIKETTPEDRIKLASKVFMQNIDNNLNQIEKKIRDDQINIESHNRSVVNTIRSLEVSSKTRESIQMMKKSFETVFMDKLNELKDLTFLKSYGLKEGYVLLDYGDIIIESGKRNYFIGNMVAKIYPDKITFDNLNNKAGGDIHPHVNGSGWACFGSFTEDINKLLAGFEFRKLAIMLRQFLHTWNPNSPISQITQWKEKSFAQIKEENDAKIRERQQAMTKAESEISKVMVSLTPQEKAAFLKRLAETRRSV